MANRCFHFHSIFSIPFDCCKTIHLITWTCLNGDNTAVAVTWMRLLHCCIWNRANKFARCWAPGYIGGPGSPDCCLGKASERAAVPLDLCWDISSELKITSHLDKQIKTCLASGPTYREWLLIKKWSPFYFNNNFILSSFFVSICCNLTQTHKPYGLAYAYAHSGIELTTFPLRSIIYTKVKYYTKCYIYIIYRDDQLSRLYRELGHAQRRNLKEVKQRKKPPSPLRIQHASSKS